jgi:DNA replicative helicase MCM subunit Mcm2 (Cdc46/Mcm family)
MSKKKKIGVAVIFILVLIQFIRPENNEGVADTSIDITHAVTVTPEIKNMLEKSCYDCHSNHTEYPWYFNFQPIAGWLAHHVEEGKDELNFSEFDTYKLKRKKHKLKEVIEQINEGEMPMSSYLIIHKDAMLNEEQKNKLIKWAEESIVTLNDTIKK